MKNNFKEKVNKFVDLYKYDVDYKIELNGCEYNIPLLIEGYEYHCYWNKKEKTHINLNNFLVEYREIIDANDGSEVFKDSDIYKQYYLEFKSKLSEIDIDFYEATDSEYDSLITYRIKIDNALDIEYMKKFTKIIEDYSSKFEEELNYLLN